MTEIRWLKCRQFCNSDSHSCVDLAHAPSEIEQFETYQNSAIGPGKQRNSEDALNTCCDLLIVDGFDGVDFQRRMQCQASF